MPRILKLPVKIPVQLTYYTSIVLFFVTGVASLREAFRPRSVSGLVLRGEGGAGRGRVGEGQE